MKSVTRLAAAAASVSRPRIGTSARPAAGRTDAQLPYDEKDGKEEEKLGKRHPRRRPDWRYLPDWRRQSLSVRYSLSRQSSTEREKKEGAWSPRKKLSPAAQAGLRTLFHADRERYTVAHLAERFRVSPEAVRRIVKSTWVPKPDEAARREARWKKRADERRAGFSNKDPQDRKGSKEN